MIGLAGSSCWVGLLWMLVPVDGFMYRPATGLTWDPSCMTWRNKTYCYFMYACCNDINATHYGHGLVAVSDDGVHFEDHSAIAPEYGNVGWFKCMIHKVEDVNGSPMFVMDHGTSAAVSGPDAPNVTLPDDRGCPAGTSTHCALTPDGTNLTTGCLPAGPNTALSTELGLSRAVPASRWDHAYIQEDHTHGGFIAFPVATPAAPRPPAPGIIRSPDGLNWTVHEPVVTEWADVTPSGFEIGGVERMPNGKYYMIGGGEPYGLGYSMFTLVSHSGDVAGPYSPDPGAYRLSGQSKSMMRKSWGQALAAWSRNYDTYPATGSALISQYMVMPRTPDTPAQLRHLMGEGGHVWLLPFRLPILDKSGHLRLSHWDGNDKMLGQRLHTPTEIVVSASTGVSGISTALFGGSEGWDHLQGVAISGTLQVPSEGVSSVGVVVNASRVLSACTAAAPCDVGPDVGWDRGGNDEHCFSVNSTYTAEHCAQACKDLEACQAWSLISQGLASNQTDVSYPCARGLPLTIPYCTLKAPFPTASIRPSAQATTGVPERAAHELKNRTQSTATVLLMDVATSASDGNSTRIWVVSDGKRTLNDVSGPFKCGAAHPCMPATTVTVDAGELVPFKLYCRHGTMELYVGSPLMLVQTTVYGIYPQSRGAIGLAMEGAAGTELKASGVEAWSLDLKVH